MRLVLAWLLMLAAVGSSSPVRAEEKPAGIPAEYRLLYSQDFSSPESIKDFVCTDPSVWTVSTADGRSALELTKQSDYKPRYRSPFNIALVGGLVFGDAIIDVDCLQTGKEYGHRDMVFVFGFQDPANYYYTHISTKADDHANQIFLVHEAPRVKISRQSNAGNNWGLNVWHHVRVERRVSTGLIQVYFDDLTHPIMTAEDKTFGPGWLGFGSFDDTGKITNIKVWGPEAEKRQAKAF